MAIVEYADFECPFCIRFAREVLPSLDEKYVQSGKVLMVFKHLPLPSHRAAFPAAEAAECAGAQQRFWEMHDRLFERPDELSSTDLRAHAGELGLDRVRFETCLEGQMKDRVQSDADLARTLKVGGTPTFFIGRVESGSRVRVLHRLAGAQPIAAFAEVLDRLIARK